MLTVFTESYGMSVRSVNHILPIGHLVRFVTGLVVCRPESCVIFAKERAKLTKEVIDGIKRTSDRCTSTPS